MKAHCTHGRPWFRCDTCNGGAVVMMFNAQTSMVVSAQARHLVAMRADRERGEKEMRAYRRCVAQYSSVYERALRNYVERWPFGK